NPRHFLPTSECKGFFKSIKHNPPHYNTNGRQATTACLPKNALRSNLRLKSSTIHTSDTSSIYTILTFMLAVNISRGIITHTVAVTMCTSTRRNDIAIVEQDHFGRCVFVSHIAFSFLASSKLS